MRHFFNFVMAAALIWIFQLIGWIKIYEDVAPFESVVANQFAVSAVIGLFFLIYLGLADFLFAVMVIGTCGVGCLLFPIYLLFLGPVGFLFINEVLPGWVTVVADEPWKIVLMGIVITVLRARAPSSDSKTAQHKVTYTRSRTSWPTIEVGKSKNDFGWGKRKNDKSDEVSLSDLFDLE